MTSGTASSPVADEGTEDSMTTTVAVPPAEQAPAADRFVRRLLRVKATDRSTLAGAHRALRTSLLVSALRCIVTYVALPVLAPVISFAGVLATPIGIALSLAALVSGTVSLRRFWSTDHRGRWMYTAFIGVVFAVIAVTLVVDVAKLVAA